MIEAPYGQQLQQFVSPVMSNEVYQRRLVFYKERERKNQQALFIGLQQGNWQDVLGNNFSCTFLVYPGSENDLLAFCPKDFWEQQLRDKGRYVLPAGVITSGPTTNVKGLLVATGFDTKHLMNLKILKYVINQLYQISKEVGARSISMAGLLPSIVAKRVDRSDIKLQKQFVKGLMASTWLVTQEVLNLSNHGDKVGVIGIGYLGTVIVESLQKQGFEVVTVDRNDNPSVLKGCSTVVAVTPQGDDIIQYADLLIKFGCEALLTDCHPRPSRNLVEKLENGGVAVYQTVATAPGVEFQPRLPGYLSKWIPGCALDAIVRAVVGRRNNGEVDLSHFNKFAQSAGIETPKIRLINDIDYL